MIRAAFKAAAGPDIELVEWRQVQLFDHELFECRFRHISGREQIVRGPAGSKATFDNARDAGGLACMWGESIGAKFAAPKAKFEGKA